MRINLFNNNPTIHTGAVNITADFSTNQVFLQGVYIPGSLSFNNAAILISASGTVSENFSLSFGLYSLNASTLSLANSANMATAVTLNQTMFSWLTLATSATQDISPGNWYLGWQFSSLLGNNFSFLNQGVPLFADSFGGAFVSGYYTNATNGLPGTIATSDLTRIGTGASTQRQNFLTILISA